MHIQDTNIKYRDNLIVVVVVVVSTDCVIFEAYVGNVASHFRCTAIIQINMKIKKLVLCKWVFVPFICAAGSSPT